MGIYLFIGRPTEWKKYYDGLRKTLSNFTEYLRQELFDPSNTVIWSGTHVKALGGKVQNGPLQGLHIPDENAVAGVYPFSIEIEGFMSIMEGGQTLSVPSYIIASNDESRVAYGDVYLDSYTFHGKTFKDYFEGDGEDKEENRARLLRVLKALKVQTDPVIKRITVGDDAESVDRIILAMYHYQKDVSEFVREIVTLLSKLAAEPVEGAPISAKISEELDEYIKPYRTKELVGWINSSESFRHNLESFIKAKAPAEAGSILIYDEKFRREPIYQLYDVMLSNLDKLKEALQPRDILKEKCMRIVENIDFKHGISQDRLNIPSDEK